MKAMWLISVALPIFPRRLLDSSEVISHKQKLGPNTGSPLILL